MFTKRSAGMAAFITIGLAAFAAPAHAVTIPVINANNNGPGSLRSAINTANQTVADDEIDFAIPGNGTHTITLASDLPVIDDPLVIDGYTQSGADPATATTPADLKIVIDAANAARGIDIGGDDVEVRGLAIHSASSYGVFVEGSRIVVAGNHIGTNRLGTAALPNGIDGVLVVGTGNTIGGPDPEDRNVIRGNQAGVRIDSGTGHVVQGNRIGTNAAGDAALGGGTGVVVESSSNTVSDNVLSGQFTGALVEGDDITLQGNHVGTDLDGNADLGNLWGVRVSGGDNNLIGGTGEGEGNLISGNAFEGLKLEVGDDFAATGNDVQANLIGTDESGTVGLPNGTAGTLPGVAIVDSNDNVIGGAPGAGNVISSNAGDGVSLTLLGADDNQVLGNLIGTDLLGTHELGNGGNGVYIDGGDENEVGDTVANTIAYNDENGVEVEAGVANTITTNSIHHNGDLGIDLGGGGFVTLNDLDDGDVGANNLQNHPLVTTATAGGATTVYWTLNSLLNETFRLDFYANDSCDASGSGEGQIPLGFAVVNTNGGGNASGQAVLAAATTAGQEISMTATRQIGGINWATSELSPCVEAL
jgi:parallel beta helix pectate lyase-like protein